MQFWYEFRAIVESTQLEPSERANRLDKLSDNSQFVYFPSRKKMVDAYADFFRTGNPGANAKLLDFNKVKPHRDHDKKTVSVSFVVTVFNRFWQLKVTIFDNLKAIRPHPTADLVIVDFGGEDSDQIREFLFENFPFDLMSGQLKYYRLLEGWNKFHMASAKNSAARLSDGEYIFSLDADNFVTSGDVGEVINFFSRHPDGVFHQTTGAAPLAYTDFKDYTNLPTITYHNTKPTWDGSAGRIGTSRKLFEGVNGYNESFVGMGMDDIDFLIRAIRTANGYHHVELTRPVSEVFIDNGSSSDDHVHSENEENWLKMDESFRRGISHVAYQARVSPNDFLNMAPDFIDESANKAVTLFSSAHRADPYIERFVHDIREICRSKVSHSIWIMDILGSHSTKTTQRLRDLALEQSNVEYIPVYHDPGLYECWNIAIRSIKSKFVSNLNIDDLRGEQWLDNVSRNLEFNLSDVSSPITVPFNDSEAIDFRETYSNNRDSNRWFGFARVYNDSTGVSINVNFKGNYYSHEDMFQVLDDGSLASYCIPNASAIWKREIHDSIGYFDEPAYGAFTDLAFWLKASHAGFRFRQSDQEALFFVSEDQAHRRQRSDSTTLAELALKYGYPDVRTLCCRQLFDLSLTGGTFGDHHLLGWNWVRDELCSELVHNESGVLLDLFTERTFFWNKFDPDRTYCFKRPWLGFVHTTPHVSKAFDEDGQSLDRLIEEPRFQMSLEHCQGLVVLTNENRFYLNTRLGSLGLNVPIHVLFHPNIPIIQDDGISRSKTSAEGYVYHIGSHLRSFSEFVKLNIPKDRKRILVPGHQDMDHFLDNTVNKELSIHGLGDIRSHVESYFHANDQEYQHILLNEIVFNSYIQPSGSNLISESISARTKLLLNRHPAFFEYLGPDYPLYYSDLTEAEYLYSRLTTDMEFVEHTRIHMEKVQKNFSVEEFKIVFQQISRNVLRELHLR